MKTLPVSLLLKEDTERGNDRKIFIPGATGFASSDPVKRLHQTEHQVYYPVRKTGNIDQLEEDSNISQKYLTGREQLFRGNQQNTQPGIGSPSAQDQPFWFGDEPLIAGNRSLLALPVHHPSIRSPSFTIPFDEKQTAKGQILLAKEQTDLCRSVSLLLTTIRVTVQSSSLSPLPACYHPEFNKFCFPLT